MNATAPLPRPPARRASPFGLPALVALLVVACAGNAIQPTRSPITTGDAVVSPPHPAATPANTAPPASSLPSKAVLDATIIDSGLRPVAGIEDNGGVNSAIAAGGAIWLAGGEGLAVIAPESNEATVVDRDRGANISANGTDLWRTAFFANRVTRYDLFSHERTLAEDQPGPLYTHATDDAVWISLHSDGKVRRLDPRTGRTTTTTVVGTPACCGAAEFATVGRTRLFVSVTNDGTLVELDPKTGGVKQTIRLAQTCDRLDDVAGYLWTCWSDPEERTRDDDQTVNVQRIDPTTFEGTPIRVGLHDGSPGVVDGEAWIPVGDRLVHLDRVTGQPDRELRLDIPGYRASQLVEAFDAVWVASRTDPRVVRIDSSQFVSGW